MSHNGKSGVTIREFIQIEVLLPRIQRNGVLVLYDPERRYRELCHGLAALAVPEQCWLAATTWQSRSPNAGQLAHAVGPCSWPM